MSFEGIKPIEIKLGAETTPDVSLEDPESATKFEKFLLEKEEPLAQYLKTLNRGDLATIDLELFNWEDIGYGAIKRITDPDTTEKVIKLLETLLESAKGGGRSEVRKIAKEITQILEDAG